MHSEWSLVNCNRDIGDVDKLLAKALRGPFSNCHILSDCMPTFTGGWEKYTWQVLLSHSTLKKRETWILLQASDKIGSPLTTLYTPPYPHTPHPPPIDIDRWGILWQSPGPSSFERLTFLVLSGSIEPFVKRDCLKFRVIKTLLSIVYSYRQRDGNDAFMLYSPERPVAMARWSIIL